MVGWAGRAFKGGKAIYKTGKAAIAAEHALDAYKTGKSLDILKMSEMGAYGLVASNGFSEAVTGRDMFGNEVSEEKRKQGGLEAALSLVGAGAMAKHVDKGIPLATHSKVQKANKTLEKVKQFKVPTNVRVYAERPVTPDGSTFGIPTVRVDVEKTAVKDLGIVKMASDGKGVKGTGKVYPTRQIDSVTEAHIIDRVKELRGNLSSKYKKSGNFAVAEVDVSGISKSEFYAQSSINELKGSLEHKVPDISLQPENPMFKATEAVGKNGFNYLRNTDTEYKILNDIASRLGDNTQASGRIKLFTELDTCDSCNKVIAEFAAKYKNIELEVVHNNGNRIIP